MSYSGAGTVEVVVVVELLLEVVVVRVVVVDDAVEEVGRSMVSDPVQADDMTARARARAAAFFIRKP